MLKRGTPTLLNIYNGALSSLHSDVKIIRVVSTRHAFSWPQKLPFFQGCSVLAMCMFALCVHIKFTCQWW